MDENGLELEFELKYETSNKTPQGKIINCKYFSITEIPQNYNIPTVLLR